MTFGKLKELIVKHNIPTDVRLLSDSGWECDETEMDGVFYNEKENHIIFTQSFDLANNKYIENKDYKELL